MKKLNALQIEKYDINQKIIKILTDLESRTILFSIVSKAKSAEDISRENKIPMTTVYKKLNELAKFTLIKIERIGFANRGPTIKYYKSRVSQAQISFRRLEPKLILYKNY